MKENKDKILAISLIAACSILVILIAVILVKNVNSRKSPASDTVTSQSASKEKDEQTDATVSAADSSSSDAIDDTPVTETADNSADQSASPVVPDEPDTPEASDTSVPADTETVVSEDPEVSEDPDSLTSDVSEEAEAPDETDTAEVSDEPAEDVTESAEAAVTAAPTPVPAGPTATPRPTATPMPEPKPYSPSDSVFTLAGMPTPTPLPKTTEDGTVRIMGVGDILYHQRVIDSGLLSDGTRNYNFHYDYLRGYLNAADVAIANQETLIVPESYGYSGYPCFGTPREVADALVNAGFNVFTLATNHVFDKMGVKGLLEAADYWKSRTDVLSTGIYGNVTDFNTLTIGEYNGVKIAFLNYTDIVNGYWSKEELDSISGDVKLLRWALYHDEIKRAKELADYVVVCPHWGVEYELSPNSRQKEVAQDMANAGADLIIGTHPHVPQPLEILTASDGRKVPCYYSLGNCISNMWETSACNLGIMADVTIKKTDKGIELVDVKAVPTVNYVHPGQKNYNVILLDDYTDELGVQHASNSSRAKPGWLWDLYHQVFGYDFY